MTYLHLGGDVSVPAGDIVAICDLDNASISPYTRDYLRRVQKEDRVISVTDDLPRSLVICMQQGEEKVYLSVLSSATLLRRSETDAFAAENTLNGDADV